MINILCWSLWMASRFYLLISDQTIKKSFLQDLNYVCKKHATRKTNAIFLCHVPFWIVHIYITFRYEHQLALKMNTCIQAFDSLFTFHKVECIKLQILPKRNECKKYYTTHDANDETSRRATATRCNGTEYRMGCQFAVIKVMTMMVMRWWNTFFKRTAAVMLARHEYGFYFNHIFCQVKNPSRLMTVKFAYSLAVLKKLRQKVKNENGYASRM